MSLAQPTEPLCSLQSAVVQPHLLRNHLLIVYRIVQHSEAVGQMLDLGMLGTSASPFEVVVRKIQQGVWETLQVLRIKKRNIPEGRPWIGLAISGGVDSMALAAVCSDLHTQDSRFRGAFRAFIVDHGVREGSHQEANRVADELERIGISAQIFKLAWGEQDPKVAKNFETLARKLRYRALGTACWDARINDLLLAHHADDQAETVLSRIVAGYMGTGLRGIKKHSRIPECEGIYGVDASGMHAHQSPKTPKMKHLAMQTPQSRYLSRGAHGFWYEWPRTRIEHGGVFLNRPLLSFTKAELIALCRAKSVQWIEDQTNADKTLTQRNTIRHLMGNDSLPAALRNERLLSMSSKLRKADHLVEHEVEQLFDAIPIQLHIRTGKVLVNITKETPQITNRSQEEAYHIKATLLRKLLLLVSPCSDIVLQDLDQAVDLVFPDATSTRVLGSTNPTKVQVAGVEISLSKTKVSGNSLAFRLALTRATPMRAEVQKSTPVPRADLPSGPTPWLLWDSRYWLRLSIDPDPYVSYHIRFLTPDIVGEVRKKLGGLPDYDKIPPSERWTLPVVLAHNSNGDLIGAGIPSLAIYASADGSQHALRSSQLLHGAMECRYKHVGFKETDNHQICVANEPWRNSSSDKTPFAKREWTIDDFEDSIGALRSKSSRTDSSDLMDLLRKQTTRAGERDNSSRTDTSPIMDLLPKRQEQGDKSSKEANISHFDDMLKTLQSAQLHTMFDLTKQQR